MADKKTYSAEQIARWSKRNKNTVTKLCAQGVLTAKKGHSKTGRPAWIIEGVKEEIVAAVIGKTPHGGWRKRVAPKVKVSKKTPANLSQVLRFMELSEATREMLLDIGEKASEDTITLLVGLV